MKKFIFPAAVMGLALTTAFSSCKKEEETTDPSVGSLSGIAFANTDETNDTLANGAVAPNLILETVPAGTKVVAKVDPSSYTNNPDPAVNYEGVTYTTETGSDGSFAFDSIKAYGTDVMVELIFSDFAEDTKYWGVDAQSNAVVLTERRTYNAAPVNVTVVVDQTQITDVTYQ